MTGSYLGVPVLGFTTVPDAIRAAGSTLRQSANALHRADCGTPVADLVEALPGSDSADAGTHYAQAWSATFDSWRHEAGAHADQLIEIADDYDRTESVNAGRLHPGGGIGHGTR